MQSKMEVIFADALSTDKTRSIILDAMQTNPHFSLIDNPERTVPFALNKAIAKSKGDIVVRMDAHTSYANDYVETIVSTFIKTNADIVGGPMRATGQTNFQKAVAYCTSTKFGIGDSAFHNDSLEGYVDSVYLGAWKRDIFSEVGYFDVQMKRNQDDEFHYRAKNKGKKIYLNPRIKSWYTPRTSFGKLFSQYYQYGMYKPLVLKKVAAEIKLRHLIPALYVTYLLLVPVLYVVIHLAALIPLLLYVIFTMIYSLGNNNALSVKLNSIKVYSALHIAYGYGFLTGLIKLMLKRF